MDKEKVANTTSRVILMLQQRGFTEEETNALIECLKGLLKLQLEKRDKNHAGKI